ncbi:flagellar hook-basal body protein [Neobacillus bataviensis LMG 21833]|uniref:Flagellar hook-basal body protein n=1 Tax=Neobacillus bataviensis LMG 21833 TaxID=1117379 RepID=K6C0P1_9BACI|nr:flagellar hook-basal body protein [Neobacillus bataviensis]EKN64730.1 flagellar hook-basal body protein [Neobacillus bataviensis LMG 21833]
MNTSLYIATSGLNTYQKKLDTISNNIANAETAGFKRREASFEENLAISITNQQAENREIGRQTPNGIRTGFGVHLNGTQMILDQGTPKATDNPLDIMINGKGFFQVGKGNDILYTRNGSFQKSPTNDGTYRLVNAEGYFLLDKNNQPVEMANGSDFSVNEAGVIAATNQQIGIVDFVNPQKLLGQGGNVFRFTGADGEILVNIPSAIQQGFIESSNVDLSKEVTDMITTQRGFQFNSRSISFADQMMGIANGIIRS